MYVCMNVCMYYSSRRKKVSASTFNKSPACHQNRLLPPSQTRSCDPLEPWDRTRIKKYAHAQAHASFIQAEAPCQKARSLAARKGSRAMDSLSWSSLWDRGEIVLVDPPSRALHLLLCVEPLPQWFGNERKALSRFAATVLFLKKRQKHSSSYP
jgi:hypothetical protein